MGGYQMKILAFAIFAFSQIVSGVATAQEQRPRPPHIGAYIPSSQLLQWCKSVDASEFRSCWSYIDGVVNSAGIVETTWPQGYIEIPTGTQPNVILTDVIAYIEKLPKEKLSKPASEAVYAALINKYRCSAWC